MSVSADDIKNFFSDMKDVLCTGKCSTCTTQTCKESNIKGIGDKPGEQRTNVIYINTDCNLRCEYCYEGDSRKGLPDQINCTTSSIDNFLNEISIREKDCVSTIVIMGGEPFLKFSLVEYIIYKSIEINKDGGFAFSLITNGTFLSKPKYIMRLKQLLEIAKKYYIDITLEVSYDSSGQFKRKWPDGSNSKDIVEEGIKNLIDNEIEFQLSYVCHSGNYKNIVKDCIYMLEKFPKKYCKRITIGYAYADLKSVSQDGFKLADWFKPYAEEIFKIYNVPICGNSCDVCNICKKDNFVGNNYLSPTGVSHDIKNTKHAFKQF